MQTSALPLAPPVLDVKRIVRLREKVGQENLYDALSPLVMANTDDKPLTVRKLAAALNVATGTAWKLKQSLPLADISNLSHAGRRAALRNIVASPQKVVTPSIHPTRKQYLTNIEIDTLVQLIDARAHNQQAIGMSGIRQYAADMRAVRLKVERVDLPSRTWYYDFEKRWLTAFRPLKPTPREYKRASAERAPEIERFFQSLRQLYDNRQYAPHCIWAADETGLEGDAACREKVQVPKVLRQGMQVKGSFRDHVSAMHICNAAGVNLPPVFSFIGKWFSPDLLDGAPVGSKLAMQENGYFEQSHMTGFFEHMVEYMDSRPDLYRGDGDITKPRLRSLLILDGAATHISGDAWEYAEQQHIDVTFLPPNLTHIMQVSDVGVFGAFKIAYRNVCEQWRHEHRGQDIDKFHIAAITGKAWEKAMTAHNVLSGFRKTGQWPLEPAAVLDQVRAHPYIQQPLSAVLPFHSLVSCLCSFSAQLTSSDKQMTLRRSLSDITRLELRVQSVESENKQLKQEMEQLKDAQQASNALVAKASAAVSIVDRTLSELLQNESRPHPGSTPKKVKKVRQSKKGHLKGVPAGQLLTQQHIIQGIKEQEAREKASAEKKATEALELQGLRKQAKAEAAAEKKRKKAEDAAAARQDKRRRTEGSAAAEEEGKPAKVAHEMEEAQA